MRCPSCKEEMVIYEYNGIEVDHCPNCGGVWLDAGELEQIIPWERLGFLQKIGRARLRAMTPKEPRIKCPACAKKMDKVCWSHFPQIILDRCPKPGGGLWFGSDELYILLQGGFDACGSGKAIISILKDVFKKAPPCRPNHEA